MITIQAQAEWDLVKVNGEFYAVTKDENARLKELFYRYRRFENAPDSENFTAYALTTNSDGHRFCNGQLDTQLRVNQLEFFLLPVIKA